MNGKGDTVQVDTRDLVSVSEASSRGISRLIKDAEEGRTPVIVRSSKTVAAVVSIAELDRLAELEENLMLLATATARLVTDSGIRHRLEDVIAEMGFTFDELAAAEEEEEED